MKLKSIIAIGLAAIVLSATSTLALTITVSAPVWGDIVPGDSLYLGVGGAFDTARDTPRDNVGGITRSPFDTGPYYSAAVEGIGSTNPEFYSVGPVNDINLPNPAVLNYSVGGYNTFSFLWGSVDGTLNNGSPWNTLSFNDDAATVITGQQILDLGATANINASWVSITGFASAFTQVVFSANQNAFEFSNIQVSNSAVNPVPVPAALPLFGTGLAIMGLFGWRRKRKATQAA